MKYQITAFKNNTLSITVWQTVFHCCSVRYKCSEPQQRNSFSIYRVHSLPSFQISFFFLSVFRESFPHLLKLVSETGYPFCFSQLAFPNTFGDIEAWALWWTGPLFRECQQLLTILYSERNVFKIPPFLHAPVQWWTVTQCNWLLYLK